MEIRNTNELNQELCKAIIDLRKGNLHHDIANGMVRLADKINRNNFNAINYKRITKHTKKIDFFE
jgi:hypothetical protein